MPVLDHVGERLARLDLAGEGEKDRPHRVVEPAVGDDHVEDRLRLVGDGVPDAERLEQPPRRRDDGRGALVVGVAAPSAGIGDRDGERRPSAWRSAIASVRPAKPPPAISTSTFSRVMVRILSRRCRA